LLDRLLDARLGSSSSTQQETLMAKENVLAGAASQTFLNVFMVENYKAETGRMAGRWTKVGVAFPHREGVGFNVELQAFPRDGRLVVLPPKDLDETSQTPSGAGASGS